MAEAWTDLGFAYSAADRPSEALQASCTAVRKIEAFIERGGDGDRLHAKCLRNLSCDLLADHQPAEAASASRAAIRLMKGLPDLTIKDILEIKGILTNLVDQCLAMNNYHEAELARRELIDQTLGRS